MGEHQKGRLGASRCACQRKVQRTGTRETSGPRPHLEVLHAQAGTLLAVLGHRLDYWATTLRGCGPASIPSSSDLSGGTLQPGKGDLLMGRGWSGADKPGHSNEKAGRKCTKWAWEFRFSLGGAGHVSRWVHGHWTALRVVAGEPKT